MPPSFVMVLCMLRSKGYPPLKKQHVLLKERKNILLSKTSLRLRCCPADAACPFGGKSLRLNMTVFSINELNLFIYFLCVLFHDRCLMDSLVNFSPV